jgi:hypothetical protein
VPEASWSWSFVEVIDKQDGGRMSGSIAEMLGEQGTIDIFLCLE